MFLWDRDVSSGLWKTSFWPTQNDKTPLTHTHTHRHECLRSSSPAWRSRSCCAGSCWACWSSPPSLPRCLRPAGRCSYPASSARKQTAGPCCSAAATQEEVGERKKWGRKSKQIISSFILQKKIVQPNTDFLPLTSGSFAKLTSLSEIKWPSEKV